MNVMFVVTHLLGTGHLARTQMLAHAFQAAGHNATIVSGGMAAAHLAKDDLHVIQLPPVRSDGVDFSRLLDQSGAPASAELLNQRTNILCATFDRINPDVLITELFPFGRRSLRAEFTALLRYARDRRPKSLICASIRDILAPPSKPRKSTFATEMIVDHYDAVLCHGDPDITPLDLSWPVGNMWRERLYYTGFVAPSPEPGETDTGAGEVIVSAGGGNVGRDVFAAALAAARLNAGQKWRLLIGGSSARSDITVLSADAPPNAILEPARPDFPDMLRQAACSVSLCGYNTALDILRAGCPAVFIPFDAGNEVEQGIRARTLSRQTGIEVLGTADLTPKNLWQKVQKARAAPPRTPLTETINGASRTVDIVENLQRLPDAG
jgi:predicted glycosyltransferase